MRRACPTSLPEADSRALDRYVMQKRNVEASPRIEWQMQNGRHYGAKLGLPVTPV